MNNNESLFLSESNTFVDSVEISIDIADAYFNKKNYYKAIDIYKQQLKDCLEYIIEGKYNSNDKIIEYEKYIKTKLSESYKFLSQIEITNKNWLQALDNLNEATFYSNEKSFFYNQIGICFKELYEYDSAIKYLKKSIKFDPSLIENYRLIGDVYNFRSEYNNAIEYYEDYIEYVDNNASVFNMLGYLYHKTKEIKKSLLYFQLALNVKPDFDVAVSNLLFSLIKVPEYNNKEIFNITINTINNYLRTINVTEKDIFIHKKRHKNKIRIGYISGDFKSHAVMNYFLPILENFDKSKFTIYIYSNSSTDYITEKIQTLSNSFLDIRKMSDKEVAQKIYSDNIDILVDLSGHTAGTRVFSLAYKPAPIQISYIGYQATTGLNTIDYFFTNNLLNKESDSEFYTEKLVFLDKVSHCFMYYNNFTLPKIETLPCLKNNYFTFGSFNDISKINTNVIKTWSAGLFNFHSN